MLNEICKGNFEGYFIDSYEDKSKECCRKVVRERQKKIWRIWMKMLLKTIYESRETSMRRKTSRFALLLNFFLY